MLNLIKLKMHQQMLSSIFPSVEGLNFRALTRWKRAHTVGPDQGYDLLVFHNRRKGEHRDQVKSWSFFCWEILWVGNFFIDLERSLQSASPASGRARTYVRLKGAASSSCKAPKELCKVKKKKKKRSPLLLYHTLDTKVKSFSRNFLKKFLRNYLLLGIFCGIMYIEKLRKERKNYNLPLNCKKF